MITSVLPVRAIGQRSVLVHPEPFALPREGGTEQGSALELSLKVESWSWLFVLRFGFEFVRLLP